MNPGDPVTLWITRTAKPGCEDAFEQALHAFFDRSLSQPGQMGVHVIRPAPGSADRTYRIVRKFDSRASLDAFFASPEYAEWKRIVIELTEGDPHHEQLTGLESWFTQSGEPLRRLPQWKMALVTFVGVYPLTSTLPRFFGRQLPGWHPLAVNVVATGAIVAALTWLIMPLLTRVFHGWLRGPAKT